MGERNLKIAICDDEKIFCREFINILESFSAKHEIFQYNSGLELLDSKEQFDIIFMDIELPKVNGMKIVNTIRQRGSEVLIVFLTSHTEFMPEAFKVKAFRFLSKPLLRSEIREVINEAEKELLKNSIIYLKCKEKDVFVQEKNIIYIEAHGESAYVCTKFESYEVNQALKTFKNRLNKDEFFQVHRSYLVSKRYIKELRKEDIKMLYTTQVVPVSRRKRKELREELKVYIKRNARVL